MLQHGSLPLTGDLARICQVLVFENEPAREVAAKRLIERASTVESALGREVCWEIAAQAFVHGFEAQLSLSLRREEISESESRRTDELVQEKYSHPSWTERV